MWLFLQFILKVYELILYIFYKTLPRRVWHMFQNFKEHDNNHIQGNLSPDCDVCMNWEYHINKAKKSRGACMATVFYWRNLVFLCWSTKGYHAAKDGQLQGVFTGRLVTFYESFVPLGINSKTKPLAVLWH